MRSGNLAQGPEVHKFEQEFAKLIDVKHAIACNSGTSALHLSLLAMGIGPGDEVIVPSFTFAATANAVRLTGATPVFADIEKDYYCVDPESVKCLINSKTRAIIPVHLYGQISNMLEISSLAESYELFVLEDAAQSHLASQDNKMAGAWGDTAAFSFYPTKNMTSGEGGMVLTNSGKIDRQARLFRNQGMLEKYKNEVVGLNYRMTDIHAAIGRIQLQKLDGYTEARIRNAEFLSKNLKNVIVPMVRENSKHVFHQYTIRIPDFDRERFAMEIQKRGISSGIYYPIPVHKLAPYVSNADLPVTAATSKSCLSLPVHPKLTMGDLESIVEVVNRVASAGC
jgi:dTDP-4-amino-4,6-dideoxygalactose transaminase